MSSPPVIRPVRKSLITIGLQASRSSSSDLGGNPQSSDPEISQSTETSTSSSDYSDQPCPIESPPPLLERPSRNSNPFISSSINSDDSLTTSEKFSLLDGPAPLQHLPLNSSMIVGQCGRMNMRQREPLGPLDPPQQQQHNVPPDPPFLVKGFGNFKIEKETKYTEKQTPCFPPLSNASYDSLNHSGNIDRSKPARFTPQLDGATLVKDYLWKHWADEQRISNSDQDKESRSHGELVAKQTNWNQKTYDPEEGPSAYPPTSLRHFKSGFIIDVDKAVQLGQVPYEMCNKCGERHIAWGPPISLQERDTCMSMLPEWFPKEKFELPWQSFIELINDVVRYSEREQGRALDPNRKTWDKEWHDATPEWRAVGRYGGWWKCRSGLGDGEENVPSPERNCTVCHREKTPEEIELDQRIQKDEGKKLAAHRFIKEWIHAQMEKDKAVVITRMQNIGG